MTKPQNRKEAQARRLDGPEEMERHHQWVAGQKGKRQKLEALKRQLKAVGSFIYACETRALIKCSIVGTILNAAKKDVVSGDYGHATVRFAQAMAQYLRLGEELNILALHLAKAQPTENPHE